MANQANAHAAKALADQYDSLKASVLSLSGDDFAAAQIRNAKSVQEARNLITQAGGDQGQADRLATLLDLQTKFAKSQQDYGLTLDALSNKEALLAVAQQTGALTTLQFLAKTGDARRAQIPLLEAELAAQEAIAKAAGANPQRDAGIASLRVQLEQLKASADPLGESLNQAIGKDFNAALDDFVTNTKSAGEAFKSLTTSILNDILKLGSKSISEALFGGSGGIGGTIADFFKTGSGQGAASSAGSFVASISKWVLRLLR